MIPFKAGIVGVGKSNCGIVQYLRRIGMKFYLTVRSEVAISDEALKVLGAERVLVGKSQLSDIDEDILFLSPTVHRDAKELIVAKKRGVILSSDAELFFDNHKGKKITVTGSDGKSSCTYLIASMLKSFGTDAFPCGNFGVSLSSVIDTKGIPVVELSSFQLNHLSPKSDYALLTNVTPNHIDWHGSLDSYVSAKKNLFYRAENITADCDTPLTMKMLRGKKLFCAVSTNYGYGALKAFVDAKNYLTLNESTVLLNGYPYFDTKRALRRESYNIKNYMLAAGTVLNLCNASAITEAIEAFRGLPHRAEYIRTVDGIKYYDSSIDSTPERTIKTLSALKQPTAVILCGKSKGLSYDDLARRLPSLTCGAVLMGEVGEQLAKKLSEYHPKYLYKTASDMTDAVNQASKLVKSGGYVALSPSGTSFDAYKNFEERGEAFQKAVLELK